MGVNLAILTLLYRHFSPLSNALVMMRRRVAGMLWLMCPKQGIVIVYYVQTKPARPQKIFIRRGLFCTMRCDILAITFGCFYVIFIV